MRMLKVALFTEGGARPSNGRCVRTLTTGRAAALRPLLKKLHLCSPLRCGRWRNDDGVRDARLFWNEVI